MKTKATAQQIQMMREVLVKVTRALSGVNIPVQQRGMKAFVEYEQKTGTPIRVVLPSLPDECDVELIDAVQGFLDHEVGHLLFTDFKAGRQYDKLRKDKLFDALHQCIEDTRIERKMQERYTGSKHNLGKVRQFVIDRLIDRDLKQMQAEEVEPGRIASLLLPSAMRALAGQPEMSAYMADKWDLMGPVGDILKSKERDLRMLTSTTDTYKLAKVLLDEINKPQPPPPPPMGSCKDGKNDPNKGEKKKGEQPPSEGKGDGDGDDDSSESGKGKSGKSKPKKEKPQKEAEPDAEQEPEKESEPEPEKADEDEKSDDSDGDSDQDDQDDDSAGDGEGDSDDDEADDDSQSDGESDDEGEEDDSDDEPKQDDEDDEPEQDDEDDERDKGPNSHGVTADDDAEDVEGDDSSGGDSKGEGADGAEADGSSEGEGESSDQMKITNDAETSASATAVPFVLNADDIKDLDEAASEAITGAMLAELRDQGHELYMPYSRELDYIGPLPPIPSALVGGLTERRVYQLAETHSHVVQQEIMKVFRARSASRWQPGLRKGKINASSLHRLTTNDDRIFRQKQESQTRSVAVQLCVDFSGSMSGDKMLYACTAAYIFANVLEKIGVMCEITGFTTMNALTAGHNGTLSAWEKYQEDAYDARRAAYARSMSYARYDPICLYVLKEFRDRFTDVHRKLLASVPTTAYSHNGLYGNNVDGECVELAAQRLLQRREARKIMIVMSDGSPNSDGDSSMLRVHLKRTVQKIEAAGIEVLALGMLDGSVKHYYNKQQVVNTTEQIPTAILNIVRSLLIA